MPTVYDLLPDDVKQAYPPDALSDAARRALTLPLPDGYPAPRAARLAASVVPFLPRLGRVATLERGAGRDIQAEGNPFDTLPLQPAHGPLNGPPAPPQSSLVRQFIARAGASVPSVAPTADLALGLATGLSGVPSPGSPLPGANEAMERAKAASITEPPPVGAAQEAAALAGSIAGFGAGTEILAPLVGPTAALGITAAGPGGDIKSRGISAATTMAAGKLAGVSGGALAPLLTRMASSGVPGRVAAYVVSHLPESAAFGALQPVAQAAIHRITGSPDYPMPTPQEMLEGAGKLAAAGLVMGIPEEMGKPAPPSPELQAALEHVARGGIDPLTAATDAALGVGAPEGKVVRVPPARTSPGTENPLEPAVAPPPAARVPALHEVDPNTPIAIPPNEAPPRQTPIEPPWAGNEAPYPPGKKATAAAAAERDAVALRIEALDKNEPKRSDKDFARWQRRRDALQARHDELSGILTERGWKPPEPAAGAPPAPEPVKEAAPAGVAANPDLFTQPAGAEPEGRTVPSEPAPAPNGEAPASTASTDAGGSTWQLHRLPNDAGEVRVLGPDGTPTMVERHAKFADAEAKYEGYVAKAKEIAARPEPGAPTPAPEPVEKPKAASPPAETIAEPGRFKTGDRVTVPQQGSGKALREEGIVTGTETGPGGKPVYKVSIERGYNGRNTSRDRSFTEHLIGESDMRRAPTRDTRPLEEKHPTFSKGLRERVGDDPAKARAESVAAREAADKALAWANEAPGKTGESDWYAERRRRLDAARRLAERAKIAERLASGMEAARPGARDGFAENDPYAAALNAAAERGLDARGLEKLANAGEFSHAGELSRFSGLFADNHAADETGHDVRYDWEHLGPGVRVAEQAQQFLSDPNLSPEARSGHRDFIEKAQRVEDALQEFDGTNAREVGEMVHDILQPNSPEAIARAEAAAKDAGVNEARPLKSRAAAQSASAPGPRGKSLPDPRMVKGGVPRDASRLRSVPLPPGYKPIGDRSILDRLRFGPGDAIKGIRALCKEVTALANPLHLATLDEPGRRATDVFMEEKGAKDRHWWATHHTQLVWERFFDTVPKGAVMDFLDAIQHGKHPDPALQEYALEARRRLDAAYSAYSSFRDGAAFRENFWPHMWADDKAAGRFFSGRRSGEGTRSFLKERFYDDIRAGLDAELELKTWNVERMIQLYEQNVAKFVMYQRFLKRTGTANKFFEGEPGLGVGVYVPAGGSGPEGYAKANPRWARIYMPPDIAHSEYVDKAVYTALQDAIQKIGASHTRKEKIGPYLGLSKGSPGQAGEILTKTGSPIDVLAHEFGHAADNKYGLQDAFIRNSTPNEKKELRALADLRWEGEKPPASYKTYVRKGPEKMAALMQAYVHMPDRLQQVAPLNYAKFRAFLDAHPELHGIRDVQRSMVHLELPGTVRAPGLVVGGDYWFPEGLARILNNHESRDFITASRWGRGAMATRNNLNMLQLGLSGFHATGVTLLASMHMMGTSIGDLLRGDLLGGGRKFAESLLPGVAAARYRMAGAKIMSDIQSPDLASAFRGGMTLEQFPEYKTGAIDRFIKHANRVRSGELSIPARAGSAAIAAANTPFAALTAPMRVLTDFYIPQVKVGAFADELSTEMARRAKDLATGKITQSELERRTWANIDDRFGLLNYDNLFWNRTLKTALMILTRAPGWTHGTQRALGGAAFIDLPRFVADAARAGFERASGKTPSVVPDFTPRMRFALSMTFYTLAAGGLYHFAHTGRPPKNLEDCLEPENGAVDASGHFIRVTFPTYMKDVRGWAANPIKEAFGKLSPLAAETGEVARFYGDPMYRGQIKEREGKAFIDFMLNQLHRAPLRAQSGDPYVRAAAVMAYLYKSNTPFSIQNAAKMKGRSTAEEKAESFMGITRAPVVKGGKMRPPDTSAYRSAGGSR